MQIQSKFTAFQYSFIFLLTMGFLTVSTLKPAQAARNTKYASIVVDARTGQVLSERYADKRLHPASLTKIMTIYMAFDALKTGKLKRHQRLRVSKHAASMVPSKLGLKPGSSIRVDHAISALVTKSANDVAVVLAEAIGGSESKFAYMMTRKARTLGMRHTVFRNASGLHNKHQISTARDMSVLARSVMMYHPEYYKYFSMQQFKYAGKTYRNHNKLMKTYKGMDGIKTGYVRASGFNLVASAVRDGRRLIGVVFGGRSSKTRNSHMATLLDSGFAKAHRYRLAKWEIPTPRPSRKPVPAKIQVASLKTNVQRNFKTAAITPQRKPKNFDMIGLVVGEGDIDHDAQQELVKSLKAISETKAGISKKTVQRKPAKTIQVATGQPTSGWQIQIGAFTTQKSAHHALNKAIATLSKDNKQRIIPRVMPLSTQRGTIYRARIAGFSRANAVKTCEELNNCIIVATAQ